MSLPSTTDRINADGTPTATGFGLFGMGAVERLAIAAAACGLIALAAWWALA